MQAAPTGRNRRIRTIVLLMLFGFFLYRIDLFWGLIQRFLAIVSAFIIGGVMAMLINLPMRLLERHLPFGKSKLWNSMRRVICLALSVLLVLAITLFLLLVIIPEVVVAMERLINRIPGLLAQLEAWLGTHNTSILAVLGLQGTNEDSVRDLFQRGSALLLGGINFSSSVVITAAQLIINSVIGLVFSIYLLYSKERITAQVQRVILAYMPRRHGPKLVELLRRIVQTYSSFIGGQCLQSLVSSLIIYAVMAVLGFPYAVLVALLTFICAFIPIFGPFIAGFLGALLVYTAAPQQVLWFLIMYMVVQQLEGSLIYPRILSNAINIPSIWVLVAVTLGGGIMGVAGMLLFIPLAAVAYHYLAEDSLKRIRQKEEAQGA